MWLFNILQLNMKKYFALKEDQIIFYPNSSEIIAAIILFLVFVLGTVVYIQSPSPGAWTFNVILILFLFCAIFVYISSKTQIIIDKGRREIVKKSFGVYKFISSFDDIERVVLNNHLFEKLFYYTLIQKEDRFGDGIKLISPQRHKSKKAEELSLIIAELNILFANENLSSKSDSQLRCFSRLEDGVFIYKKNSLFPLVFGLIALSFSIAGFYHYNTTKSPLQIVVVTGFALFALFLIKNFRVEIKINTLKKFVEKSMWKNIFKKRCYFEDINYISVQKSYSQTLETRKEFAGVNVYLRVLYSEKKMSLATFNNSKKANELINDLEKLLNRQSVIE